MIYIDTALVAINGLLLFRVWQDLSDKGVHSFSWPLAWVLLFFWPLSWVNFALSLL
jgi:hypothetical protein